MKGYLVLEDGTVFEGTSFGAAGHCCGEVVFNTAMSGYQEVLTDPSYYEQIVTMTYPLIGNVGTNDLDWESRRLFVSGFIVKENCPYPSNWRDEQPLSEYLEKNGIVAVEGIDTRQLVRHIRTKGAMKGIISAGRTSVESLKKKLEEYPGLVGRDIVKDVTVEKAYKWDKPYIDVLNPDKPVPPKKYKVVAVDYGLKENILRLLRSHGCEVHVVPANATAKKIMAKNPDGVFLANGPGDPAPLDYAADTVRELLGTVPIFGICLGNQILGIAMGGKTYKLKFGHHGANHPVKNLETGQIEITSQNHGFVVDHDTLSGTDAKITHMNLNDNTVEGIRSDKLMAFSVQYHPEASPGPHDSHYLFQNFIDFMEKYRKKKK